jgi:hypothetical protein
MHACIYDVRISRYCTVLFVLSSYLEGFESRYSLFLLQTSVDHNGREVTFLGGEERRKERKKKSRMEIR